MMTEEQYKALMSECNSSVKPEELKDQSDRTLLYGYDLDRNTHHVYLKEGVIHFVLYGFPNKILVHIQSNISGFDYHQLIPDKRLYPAACDMEFCRLLLSKGAKLPFTTFEEREPKPYYGFLAEELD